MSQIEHQRKKENKYNIDYEFKVKHVSSQAVLKSTKSAVFYNCYIINCNANLL